MIDQRKHLRSILKFVSWHEAYGDTSFDRMDFWASKFGIFAKKLFYRNKVIGMPFAFIGLLLENFLPRTQNLFGHKHREVIGDGHFAIGYLNLFEITGEKRYLNKAETYLDEMLNYSTNDYSGFCWGYNFGWQTYTGYWSAGIPLITITPYAFWAFVRHYKVTGDERSRNIALSISDFALKDLNETIMPNGTFCASYSPVSQDIVINANTYRAAVLLGAYELTGNIEYKHVAERNIQFVLSYQQENGSWFYEAKSESDNFIDNFHTCFVLRNLIYCYEINGQNDILVAVKKGYKYYLKNLFYDTGRPRHFSVQKYAKLRKFEMYDYAEGIKLGVLMARLDPKALNKALFLAEDLIDNFQLKRGYFVTRITSLGTMHRVPYLRWPQAQLFCALTELLISQKR